MLAVMAIIGVLAALAIPAFTNLGAFARSDLSLTARNLYSKLRAARIYAETYSVNAGVVYSLDNWIDPPLPNTGLREPIVDTLTDQVSRVIVAAAVMYELPSGPYSGTFVPVPGREGNFESFRDTAVVYLRSIDEPSVAYYADDRGRFVPATEVPPPAVVDIDKLGMSAVRAYLEGSGPLSPDPVVAPQTAVHFPTHVFTPTGRIQILGDDRKERYTMYIVARPNLELDERLIDTDIPFPIRGQDTDGDGTVVNNEILTNLLNIPIELYRSTGRVKIGS